ncbi:DUF1820 family protein [Neiella marina]|uniref:DUF1820 family protein n=1 Tax=Neiella holothuriorum TaxID=2870530 RepID=A0ABS7EFM6_9GAMM|nr:DUF1820 family protein [Neiella holothuriorum]MBW8191149.1 DUF1820 family protein [Neiella holothuriorum]
MSEQGSKQSSEQRLLYRIQFVVNGEQYQLFVREVVQGSLWGFIEIADFVWNTQSELLVDTAEERLKSEFAGVNRTYLPMHNVLRIDAVEQRGRASIKPLSDKVTPFPAPIYTKGK